MSEEKKIRKITVGGILSWLFGVLFLLGGLGMLIRGSIMWGLIIVVCSALIIPAISNAITNKFRFELSKGIKFILVIIIFIGIGMSTPDSGNPNTDTSKLSNQQTVTENNQKQAIPSKQIVSTTFSDFNSIYCDPDSTTLKIETEFDEKYKGKYVTWTGIVVSVTESVGNYKVTIRHCDDTWTADIEITMKSDQKDKLLQLKEDDEVTYTAKLKSIGGIFTDIHANDGEIVTP